MTTKESLNHQSYLTIKETFKEKINLHVMPSVDSKNSLTSLYKLFTLQISFYLSFKKGFKKASSKVLFDHIFIVNFDHCDKIFSLLGSPFGKIPYSGILMNIKFHREAMHIGPKSRSDLIYKILFNKLLNQKRLFRIFVVDEVFFDFYKNKSNEKLILIPEPLIDLVGNSTKTESRISLNILNDDFIVLIFGSLSARKGINELINSVYISNLKNVSILLAGNLDDSARKLLEGNYAKQLYLRKQLILFSGFQEEERQYQLFNASDIVWVAYGEGFTGSSGIYYQSTIFAKPVITSNQGLLAYLVKKYKNGVTCELNSNIDIAKKIYHLKNNREEYELCSNNSSKLSIKHRLNYFGKEIVKEILKEKYND